MTQANGNERGSQAGRARERLNRTSWLEAGQALLIEHGIKGLRLATLTRHLGVSTGSFYHHFADMETFVGALADHYSTGVIDRLIADIRASEPDPIEQLKQLYLKTEAREILRLDSAMRNLAIIEPRAAAAMSQSEGRIMTFMTEALVQAGFDADAARARAFAMLSIEVSVPLSLPAEEVRRLRRRVFLTLTNTEQS